MSHVKVYLFVDTVVIFLAFILFILFWIAYQMHIIKKGCKREGCNIKHNFRLDILVFPVCTLLFIDVAWNERQPFNLVWQVKLPRNYVLSLEFCTFPNLRISFILHFTKYLSARNTQWGIYINIQWKWSLTIVMYGLFCVKELLLFNK